MPRGAQNIIHSKLETQRKPVNFWLPRIRLLFCAEDPIVFSQRVHAAYALRRKTEILLRYHLYIDCMPTDGVPNIAPEMLDRITNFAKGSQTGQRTQR